MRFHYLDIDENNIEIQNLVGWYGVVDETKGGFIAYFSDSRDADNYIDILENEVDGA